MRVSWLVETYKSLHGYIPLPWSGLDMRFRYCFAILFMLSIVHVAPALGQNAADTNQKNDTSESSLIEEIKESRASVSVGVVDRAEIEAKIVRYEKALSQVDKLLSTHPGTSFKEDALVFKMEVLSELSRIRPKYQRQLLKATSTIAEDELIRKNPKGKLASENAFFAIQAFVYGARSEGMPRDRQRQGAVERYEGFLNDYQASGRRSLVFASLIRNQIGSEQFDKARMTLKKLAFEFPASAHAAHAQTELLNASVKYKKFEGVFVSEKGKTIRSKDSEGKILIVHYWSKKNRLSYTKTIVRLLHIFTNYADLGVAIIGVSLDQDPDERKSAMGSFMTPWPRCIETEVSKTGDGTPIDVVVPTFLVVNRKGVIQSVAHNAELEKLMNRIDG